MKKNGFIATTLIYSFFLVFCAVILSFIGISNHNRNMLNKANENIRKDILEKTMADLSIGSIINLDVSTPTLQVKNTKWQVFYNDKKTVSLVSVSAVLTNKNIDYIKYLVSSLSNACIINNIRVFSKDDLYVTLRNTAENSNVLKSIANMENVAGDSSYLVMDNDKACRYTYREPNSAYANFNTFLNTVLNDDNLDCNFNNEPINVRVVIDLNGNSRITSGSGTISNPYYVDENNCFTDLSLVNKILSKGHVDEHNYTTPGIDVAFADEGVRSTPDDYGISYYFRGNVKNNYIVFGGKCWRIVRITGNGSIKLILQNNEGTQCNVSGDKGFIYETGATTPLKVAYNTNADDNAYIGFMYSTSGANYDNTHNNVQRSTVLQKLQDWYHNWTITNNTFKKLTDVVYCNDKSIDKAYLGYGKNETYYMGYYRLTNDNSISSSISPSLICPNSSSNNSLLYNISKFTSNEETIYGNGKLTYGSLDYKVGLLTADEAAFAGLTTNKNDVLNVKSYLVTNSLIPWWTMTPMAYLTETKANVYGINSFGVITEYAVNNNTLAVRPVIALKPNTLVSGAGTINDPYIVK